MFTLVTGIVGRWRAVCVTALQRPNSDAAAIRIVVGIARCLSVVTLNVKGSVWSLESCHTELATLPRSPVTRGHTGSSGLSPPYIGYQSQTSQDAFGSISIPSSQPMDLNIQPSEKKIKKMKGKLPFTQRQSASEREKMRMRNLSKALQNLRRYLPPSVVPIDKTLTKIETLQLTIRYISYLSAQLGLSKEVLEQRRQTFKQRTKCAQSISCYIDTSPSLCSEPVKENMSLMESKEHKSSTSSTAVRSQCQNTRKRCQMPYDFPQCSELQVRPVQNYPVTFAALSQPSNDHVTSHPQMITTAVRLYGRYLAVNCHGKHQDHKIMI
ncbi:unnamed protein product [Ranitomeya imitator]|uniref:BHLH domain-containing protein n=1 Tax=Ranitomeya imitator TaxID=111125 RepID=A0ABN9LF37_9NEOB|nr:unnamed protein product [Ranitomeya imitator]